MNNLRDPALQEALQNELNILRTLRGKNTCGLINEYGTNEFQYIILPFCNDGDLRKHLNKNKNVLQEGEAKQVMR